MRLWGARASRLLCSASPPDTWNIEALQAALATTRAPLHVSHPVVASDDPTRPDSVAFVVGRSEHVRTGGR